MKYSVTTAQVMKACGEENAFRTIKDAGFDYSDYSYTLSSYKYSPDSLYSASDADFERVFMRHKKLADEAGVIVGQRIPNNNLFTEAAKMHHYCRHS